MTLPAYPNSISLNQIQAEFGGATPAFYLSQYYAGGGRVPSGTIGYPLGTATAIPSSGTISLGNFSGATYRLAVTVTISASTVNYIANTSKVSGYVSGFTDVTFVINSGVVVGSASTGSYAFTVDTSWAAGDTVRVTNNGTIIGASGYGGAGGNDLNGSYVENGGAGAGGGPAILVQRTVTNFDNTSGTAGGGGGGGGGGGTGLPYFKAEYSSGGNGGGGGRGFYAGNGGAGGSSVNSGYEGGAGGNGSSSAAGAGGTNGNSGYTGGTGGAGGGLASAGGAGGSGDRGNGGGAGGAGGGAGSLLYGRSYVNSGTGISNGTYAGSQSG